MKLGIRGHDLGVKGVEGLVGGLGKVGINALQLVCYKSFEDIFYRGGALEEKRAEGIGATLRENGVEVALLGAYFNPVHPDESRVGEGIEVFKEYLRFAKAIGTSVVGSETGSYNGDKWTYHPQNRTIEAQKRVVSVFRELCGIAAENGVFVGIEGAAAHVCYNVSVLARVVKEIGDNVRIIFDLYNFMDESNAGNYIDILEEGLSVFGSKIHCFHIKDCVVENGKPIQCPVGKGSLDFKEIFCRIKGHNENSVLILEGTVGENIAPAVSFIKETWSAV